MLTALMVKTRKNSCKISTTAWTSRVSAKKGDLKHKKTKLNEKMEKLTNYKPILITNGVNRIDGPS